ncbi:MAG: hypothetical protein MRY32_09620 [Rickettsiales bacterium]|nr:hypothetical protein [Rickettsiales bacterium]
MSKHDIKQTETILDLHPYELVQAQRMVNDILNRSAISQGKIPDNKYQMERIAVMDLLRNTKDFGAA